MDLLVACSITTFLDYFGQNFFEVVDISAALVCVDSGPKLNNSLHQLLFVSGFYFTADKLLELVPQVFYLGTRLEYATN